MLKTRLNRTMVFNYVCALLTLALLVLQFTPFWHYNGKSASINGYVWLNPQDNEIKDWFAAQLGTAQNVNSIVISSVLVLLFGVVGMVLCVRKSKLSLMTVLPAVASLSGIYAFIFKPVFRLGSTWIIQFVLCLAILIIAVLSITYSFNTNKYQEE